MGPPPPPPGVWHEAMVFVGVQLGGGSNRKMLRAKIESSARKNYGTVFGTQTLGSHHPLAPPLPPAPKRPWPTEGPSPTNNHETTTPGSTHEGAVDHRPSYSCEACWPLIVGYSSRTLFGFGTQPFRLKSKKKGFGGQNGGQRARVPSPELNTVSVPSMNTTVVLGAREAASCR